MNPLKIIDYLAFKLAKKFVDIRNAFGREPSGISVKNSDEAIEDLNEKLNEPEPPPRPRPNPRPLMSHYSLNFDKCVTQTEKNEAIKKQTKKVQDYPEYFV